MISNGTLGDLIDQGFRATAFCNNRACRHSSPVDLLACSLRLGRDHPAIGLPNPIAARLVCEKCGGKDIGIILSPGGVSTPVGGHSLS